jgi:uncharacterized protein (TIGR02265 family)
LATPRIKGSATLHVVKWLRTYEKDRARELLSPRLRTYLDDRILVSSWYPVQDHLHLLRLLARLMREGGSGSEEEIYASMGRHLARQNFSTVYAHMISPTDPGSTIRHCPVWWEAYHDTGQCTVAFPRPRTATVEVSDFRAAAPEFCRIHQGIFTELLRMSGARVAEIAESRCVHRGAPSCTLELSWS